MKLIIAIIVFLISTLSYSQDLWHENWDHYELDGSWEIKSSLDGWSKQNDSLIGKKIYKHKHWIQVPEDKLFHSTRECQILATDFGKDGNNESLYLLYNNCTSNLFEIDKFIGFGFIYIYENSVFIEYNGKDNEVSIFELKNIKDEIGLDKFINLLETSERIEKN